jgi:hypothetical protein
MVYNVMVYRQEAGNGYVLSGPKMVKMTDTKRCRQQTA